MWLRCRSRLHYNKLVSAWHEEFLISSIIRQIYSLAAVPRGRWSCTTQRVEKFWYHPELGLPIVVLKRADAVPKSGAVFQKTTSILRYYSSAHFEKFSHKFAIVSRSNKNKTKRFMLLICVFIHLKQFYHNAFYRPELSTENMG